MFTSLFAQIMKPAQPKGFEQGRLLFERGMKHASRFETDRAIDLYTRSIAACKNPAPYINRANLLCKKIRHHDALQDLIEAKRLDVAGENQFARVLKHEIRKAQIITCHYETDIRQRVLDDLVGRDHRDVARALFRSCFDLSEHRLGWSDADARLVEFHFFNELDNIAKFENLELYPEAREFLADYSAEFVEHKVAQCPDPETYAMAEAKLHSFLCLYEEEDMRRLRRSLLYDIHCRMLELDFGDLWNAMDSGCTGVIREAQSFMENHA